MEPCDVCGKRIAVQQDLYGRFAYCAVCLQAKLEKDYDQQRRDEVPDGD
jgi:hypothetical protein